MNELSWQDIETYSYACFIVICTVSLAIIYVFVVQRCDVIFLAGDDCGVGWGWVGLAVAFFVIGVFSVWRVWRLAGTGSRPE